jgi:hypothetical protein
MGNLHPHFCHPSPSARITPLVDGLQIIGIPDEVRLASHPRADGALEPEVEHVVKVDVALQRRQA